MLVDLLRGIPEPGALVLAALVTDVFAHSAARRLLDHRLMAQMARTRLAQLLCAEHVTLRFEFALDEQVDRLADAEWFTSSGLSASATQTLYPRHSSSVFSPLRCPLFAITFPLLPSTNFFLFFFFFVFSSCTPRSPSVKSFKTPLTFRSNIRRTIAPSHGSKAIQNQIKLYKRLLNS